MQKTDEAKLYELINSTFKDMALNLGEIARTHTVDDKIITLIANSIEDIYYKAIDKLELLSGTRVIFNSEEYVRSLHPHPAIDSLLKAIGFKPSPADKDKICG